MGKLYKMYIDGKWVQSSSGEKFNSLDPSTGKTLCTFQKGTVKDAKAAISAAKKAFPKWSSVPPPKRGDILFKVARMLQEQKESLAKEMTQEMGKVLEEARGDVQEAIDMFYYMAGEGRRMFSYTTTSELPDKVAYAIKRPVGVCGMITPWNFPIAIPAWKIAPALIAGNTMVFKPSSDTPFLATRLVEILEKAGIPKGVVNLVTGGGSTVGAEIVKSKDVDMISFTGSRETGLWITQNAGLKKVGLELGGKNAIIVMDDAKLDLAVDGIIWGAYGTTGQRCTAASRVIVHEKVKKKLENALVKRINKLKLGNGLNKKTDIGPLVNKKAVEKIHKYVEIGKKEGAKMLCGGSEKKGEGFFYLPTLFTDVKSNMRIAQEEIFGPVVSVMSAKNLDDAIKKVNDVEYGLSSAIYTSSIRSAFKAIEKIQSGITYVNSSTIGSEAHLPFGGVKDTGNGTREGGWKGLEEFTEEKTVYFDYSDKLQRAQIDLD